ncbi:hypothetical protein MOX02_46670 [Methylobacterium oxalidis]|uniref:Uncharacterized protein n=1 Tax=Methylobacterium oxalidis TaxID=944322 RepID=A0A512J9S8_9HYPH|nr:hypothetical protein MOX02_46670 [Methylobacterium oxalidis]GLS66243.1 hypothetical protein GCM10007888_46250 [Methylobacterium oxalidis]
MWVAEIVKPGAHLLGKNAFWVAAPVEACGSVSNLIGTTVNVADSTGEVIAATTVPAGRDLQEGDTIGIVVRMMTPQAAGQSSATAPAPVG